MILEGPYIAGCLLLVGAGLAKAVHPGDTARAVSQLLKYRRNLALASHVIRLLALLETLLGAAALLLPGTTIRRQRPIGRTAVSSSKSEGDERGHRSILRRL